MFSFKWHNAKRNGLYKYKLIFVGDEARKVKLHDLQSMLECVCAQNVLVHTSILYLCIEIKQITYYNDEYDATDVDGAKDNVDQIRERECHFQVIAVPVNNEINKIKN